MSYKITTSVFGEELIFNVELNAWIPAITDNADYQQYLVWLEEGNEPEPWELKETE